MHEILLNGEWVVKGGTFKDVPAKVPGCVHTDLLEAGLIPDPFYRDTEKKLVWIGKTDWEYSRSFEISEETLTEKKIVLRCGGLDTFAHIFINGIEVASTDNMFRSWEFDVRDLLVKGENKIRILFESTYPYMEKRNRERYLHVTGANDFTVEGNSWVRKMQCNYGWDWGPICVTCGIWRDIKILAYSSSRINDVVITQEHFTENVELKCAVELERLSAHPVDVTIKVSNGDDTIACLHYSTEECSVNTSFIIENPKLWWPHNMGEQNLYDVAVMVEENGIRQDLWHKKIGLRTLRLDRHVDQWGESFQFVVNGIPFFAKGANWIPADTFVTRASDKFYVQLIRDAVNANMNFLRVWGGGIYEQDIFYETCDKYGICVWQDFMFACSAYPAFDSKFMENIRLEAVENIKRLRDHACIALWCGNNEIEAMSSCVNHDISKGAMSWDEYKSLFDNLLADIVYKHAPGMDYWPSSPHTPGREAGLDAKAGDAHLWNVWHGREPFEWYRTCEHRFISEFGFQSFPEPRIVNSYTIPEDRNVTSYVMEHHQRSGIGNDAIIQYMLSWFRMPSDFNMLLWLSQILQGMAMKYGIEHWRRSMPRCMGTLYWQFNDCWPAPSWASLDYQGNWKALHYMARKFFSPVLISCVEDIQNSAAEIHLTNDKLYEITGTIFWKLVTIEGYIAAEGAFGSTVGANSSKMVQRLDLKDAIAAYGERNTMLYVSFKAKDELAADNLSLFCRPKHMELKRPDFSVGIEYIGSTSYKVLLSSNIPALWVWVEVQGIAAKYSDNFIHMLPGYEVEIVVELQRYLTSKEVEEGLKVYSLVDTYR